MYKYTRYDLHDSLLIFQISPPVFEIPILKWHKYEFLAQKYSSSFLSTYIYFLQSKFHHTFRLRSFIPNN